MALDSLSVSSSDVEIPFSIIDTDLYKLSMQNAVLRFFPDARVSIKFTNRAPEMLFSRPAFDWIQEHVNRLSNLHLQPNEREFLSAACPYFPTSYLDFLEALSLDPKEQVKMSFHPKTEEGGVEMGEISCMIQGLWRECILYEVPIMSILSEGYFKFVDTDWNLDGQVEQARRKAELLLSPPKSITPIIFSEFGTRRRRSFHAMNLVMQGLVEGYEEYKRKGGKSGVFSGTSNVYFAMKYGLKPVGTIAHEWIMAIGAVYGYRGANGRAMDMWEEVYPRGPDAAPLTMLTDTFTAEAFFVDFIADPVRALRWTTLRQDSGDAMAFVRQAKEAWKVVERAAESKSGDGNQPVTKRVIFSDGLDVDRALALQKGCDDLGIAAAFGIGTFLTNDFRRASDSSQVSKPLNIVIKLNQIDGRDCVKLSDDKGKYTGNIDEVKRVQRELGLAAEHEQRKGG
ncbi:putative nicotinate phosphoribosyltransferase [Naematelia encephala]|uniref:Nicotinate phosphoribosyltransferase n=1 Tax=Naematelia encephala TaxID=71784 RepID=A0A1Y2B9D4_9TREE|nr:putative nicotinate phosphoribosyltransferase [Naematelia encephala]